MWWCIHALLCVTMKLLLFYYSCMHAALLLLIMMMLKLKKHPKKNNEAIDERETRNQSPESNRRSVNSHG